MICEATAPTRVDLAGGTLDIWPLYLFHPGSLTVNVAIDRRARCRVETGIAGMHLESRDTGSIVEGRDVHELLAMAEPPLAAFVLSALGVQSGMRVVTESRVPAGSGLGGSSALAVATAAAASHALGRRLEPDELLPIVRDAEAQCIGVPTGVQDYLAALQGGALALHLNAGGVRVERLALARDRLEQRLLLVDPGARRFSGINNWQVFKAQVDGDAGVREALAQIARVARRTREALLAGEPEAVAELLREEWETRKRLAPGVVTPETERVAQIALALGGAAKVCGAGGGGVVAVWDGCGQRERLRSELRGAGFALVPFRMDEAGLAVCVL